MLNLVLFAQLLLASLLWAELPELDDLQGGSLVLDSRGQMLRFGLAKDGKYRLPITMEQIPAVAIEATLAYEDKYFYYHPGINPVSLCRGACSLLWGRRQGGSTLTMQVARLRYHLKTDTVGGKLRQIWYALILESRYTKQQILTAYFNLAPYGGNVEGLEAASRIYFHKGAAALTSLEAKALAVIPQNPVARHPEKPAFQIACQRVTGDNRRLAIHSTAELPFKVPHLAMEVGSKPGIWRTGIEQDLQQMLERNLRNFASRGKKLGLENAAALLLRPQDMQIIGLAGSADYHNEAISGQIDGTKARRSPGSTLKPFIYALALEQGLIAPGTILADSPRSFNGYDPGNFDRGFRGPVAAHEALKASRNLPAITLAQQLKYPDFYQFLEMSGVQFKHKAEHYGLALVLGGAEITMRELAGLYAMLLNQGLFLPLEMLKVHPARAPRRLLSPAAAWLTLKMLEREEDSDIPLYYKTGTSNGMRDAWTAGIIGQYVLVVWVGNFDNRSNPELVGARVALPLFQQIAKALASCRNLANPLKQMPEDILPVQICPETGDIFAGQCMAPEQSYYIASKTPRRSSGITCKILIDRATGLRACEPGNTYEAWYEFWPTDLLAIFEKAGVYKQRPPDFLPECHKETAGMAPKILLPKPVLYQRRLDDSGFRLPLQAAADVTAHTVHWYAGNNYLGSTTPGQILPYRAEPGKFTITAVDDLGRSASQHCEIRVIP